jgi:hypothetical protein
MLEDDQWLKSARSHPSSGQVYNIQIDVLILCLMETTLDNDQILDGTISPPSIFGAGLQSSKQCA